MTPEETVAYIREFAARQEAFAGPDYTQTTEVDRKAFRHTAQMLREVADRLERKYREEK